MPLTITPPQSLSVAEEPLNWSVVELFTSPVARISQLRCRPDTLACSCEKCAVENQLVFVKRGGFVKHTASGKRLVNAAKAVLFAANDPYRTSHIDPSGDECIVLSFREHTLPEETAAAFTADSSGGALHPTVVRDAIRLALGLRARSIDALQAEEGAVVLLDQTLPAYRRQVAAGPSARTMVHCIEEAMTAEPGAEWSLMSLSRMFKKSPFYITRSFSAIAGLPLHQYLLNLRIATALGRLAEGEDNLAGLAFDLGFSSHAHFSASFKATLGESPSAFRRASRSTRPTPRRNSRPPPK